MSLKKSAIRLSLLAGSSLAAGGLALAALAPSAAFAANECSPTGATGAAPGTNGATADTYECASATYAGGVTYDAEGNLTVTKTGAGTMTVTATGVNLTANASETLTWNSTAGALIGGDGTAGPVLHLSSTGSGAIVVSTGVVSGTNVSATHGILAQSTGGGNVSVTVNGNINPSGGTSGGGTTTNVNATTGLEARSNGDGDVTVTVNGGNVSGRVWGVVAQATGTGDVTVNFNGGSIPNHNVATGDPTAAAIYAKTGTGLLTINATQSIGNSGSRDHSAIRIETGGDAVINMTGSGMSGTVNAVVHLKTSAGTNTVLTHTERPGQSADNVLVFRAEGEGDIVINSVGEVRGRVDFAAMTGDLTWTIGNRWSTLFGAGFGLGDDTVTIGPDAFASLGFVDSAGAIAGGDNDALEAPYILAFNGGDDRMVNNGLLVVGPKYAFNFFSRYQFNDHYESETRFTGLETFENNGSIYFGSSAAPGGQLPQNLADLDPRAGPAPWHMDTDYWHDDVLLMPGAHWIGGPGSRLVMDAMLIASQPACDVSLRNTTLLPDTTANGYLSGEMPAADCMGLQGGSTEGETLIQLNVAGGGDRGGPLRIVLVDVAGGTSGPGHFLLDPISGGYNPDFGGFIDLGYFIMPLVYDPDTQQHLLLGTAGQNAWQTAGLATAAQDVWRTSTGSWFDRQADLRGGMEAGGGIWLRGSSERAERDLVNVQQAGATTFNFDNSYTQSTYAVTGGADLIAGGAWVVGVMAGYAYAETTYEASPNRAQFDSWNGGVYGSFVSGGLYVGAAVNANKADLKADMPALNLFPAGTILDTRLLSVGVQVEAGYRFDLPGGTFVEPLAGASRVTTRWDNLPVPSADPLRAGVEVDFNDPVSLRANVGARLGLDQDYGAVRAQYSLLGRVWKEFEGEHSLTLHNVVADAFVTDAFTGTLSEVGLSASVQGGAVSGFLNLGGKFAEDYRSVGGAVGIRVAW